MATELATGYISLSVKYADGMRQITRDITGLERKAATTGTAMGRNLTRGMSHDISRKMPGIGQLIVKPLLKAAAPLAGAFAIGSIIQKGFGRLTAIDDASAKLRGLGHDAEGVKSVMDSALKSVLGTMYPLGEAASLAGVLVASGIKPGKELDYMLKSVADSAATAGVDLQRMGDIYAKAAARGSMNAQLLNQVMLAGIPVYDVLAKKLGMTQKQIAEMVASGDASKISFIQFAEAMEEAYSGAALRTGETVSGSFKNLGAALSRLGAAAIKPIFDKLAGFFQNLIQLVDKAALAVGPLIDKISGAIERMFTGISFDKVREIFADFMPRIESIGRRLVEAFARAGPLIVALAPVLRAAFAGIMEAVKTGAHLALGAIEGLLAAFNNLAPVIITVGEWLGRHPAILEAVAVGAGALTGALIAYKTVALGIAMATKAWTAAQWLLNIALDANALGFITALVVAAGVALWAFFTKTELGRKIWAALWDDLKIIVPAIGRAVTALWDDTKLAFTAAKAVIGQALKAIGEAFISLDNETKSVFEKIKQLWADFITDLGNLKTEIDTLAATVEDFWRNRIVPAFTGIRDTAVTEWNNIKNVWDEFTASINDAGTAIREFWQTQVVGAWEGITTAFTTAWQAIQQIWADFRAELRTVGQAFNDFWHNTIEPVWAGITTAFGSAREFINNIWGSITGAFESFAATFIGIAEKIKTAVSDAFKGLTDVIGAPLRALSNLPDKVGLVPIPGAGKIRDQVTSLPGLASGGVAGRDRNGRLYGPGSGTSDSIFGVDAAGVPTARVSAGEGIVTAAAMAAGGDRIVAALNAGLLPLLPRFAGGGEVTIEPFGPNTLTASVGDKEGIGIIEWAQGGEEFTLSNGVGGRYTPGEVMEVHVHPDYRGRGIATQLFDAARKVDPRVHHSQNQTAAGRAWAQAEAARGKAAGGVAHRDPKGRLHGPGFDSILGLDEQGIPTVRVSGGEGIVTAKAMSGGGAAVVAALNAGRLPRFADGTTGDGGPVATVPTGAEPYAVLMTRDLADQLTDMTGVNIEQWSGSLTDQLSGMQQLGDIVSKLREDFTTINKATASAADNIGKMGDRAESVTPPEDLGGETEDDEQKPRGQKPRGKRQRPPKKPPSPIGGVGVSVGELIGELKEHDIKGIAEAVEGLSGHLKTLREGLKEAFTQIVGMNFGEKFADMINKIKSQDWAGVSESVRGLIGDVGKLAETKAGQWAIELIEKVPGINNVQEKISGLTSTAQKMLSAFETGAGIIDKAKELNQLRQSAQGLMPLVGGLAQKFPMLGAAMSALGGPFGLILAGAVALGAGLWLFFTKTEAGKQLWDKIWTGIKATWDAIWPAIKAGLEAVGNVVTWLWQNVIQPALPAIGELFKAAWEVIKAVFEGWKTEIKLAGEVITWLWNNAVQPAWDGIKAAVTGAWGVIKPIWDAIVSFVKGDLSTMWQKWQDIVNTAWETARTAIDNAWKAIKGIWDALVSFAEGTLTTIWTTLKNAVETAWTAITTAVDNAWKAIKGWWDAMVGFLNQTLIKIWNTLQSAVESAWTAITSAIDNAWKAIKGWWDDLVEFVRKTLEPLQESLRTAVDNAWSGIRTAIGDAWKAVKGIWDDLTAFVKNTLMTIWEPLRAAVAEAWSAMKTAIEDAWTGIQTNVFSKVKGALEQVGNWFSEGVQSIGQIWDGLKKRLADPINFVINTIYNEGIKKAWDAVATFIGAEPLPKVEPIAAFASGGFVSGPGGPTADKVPAWLSSGEYVIRASVVDKLGKKRLDALNAVSSQQAVSSVLDGPLPRLAGGGFWDRGGRADEYGENALLFLGKLPGAGKRVGVFNLGLKADDALIEHGPSWYKPLSQQFPGLAGGGLIPAFGGGGSLWDRGKQFVKAVVVPVIPGGAGQVAHTASSADSLNTARQQGGGQFTEAAGAAVAPFVLGPVAGPISGLGKAADEELKRRFPSWYKPMSQQFPSLAAGGAVGGSGGTAAAAPAAPPTGGTLLGGPGDPMNLGLTTPIQQAMWDAVRTAFPGATMTSGSRSVDVGSGNDYHRQGKAIDLTGPMPDIARWIYHTYPDSLELIHWPLQGWQNLKNGSPLMYNDTTNAGHMDHVHWAMNQIISYAGELISAAGGPPTGGAGPGFNPIASIAKSYWDAIINKIVTDNNFGGQLAEWPKKFLLTMASKVWSWVASKLPAPIFGSFSSGGDPAAAGGDAERYVAQQLQAAGLSNDQITGIIAFNRAESGGGALFTDPKTGLKYREGLLGFTESQAPGLDPKINMFVNQQWLPRAAISAGPRQFQGGQGTKVAGQPPPGCDAAGNVVDWPAFMRFLQIDIAGQVGSSSDWQGNAQPSSQQYYNMLAAQHPGLFAPGSGGGRFDAGGIARGTGVMRKDVIQPERVLNPQETQLFDTMVGSLEDIATGGQRQPLPVQVTNPGDLTRPAAAPASAAAAGNTPAALGRGGIPAASAGARVPYGLPKGVNSGGYGGTGVQFPAWVNQLGAAFGIKPSTYPGHQEGSGLNKGIDWSGPTQNLQRFAEYLGTIPGAMEQVIWQNPQTGQRIGVHEGRFTTGVYGEGGQGYPGHTDHVHTRQSWSIPLPGAGPVPVQVTNMGDLNGDTGQVGAFNDELGTATTNLADFNQETATGGGAGGAGGGQGRTPQDERTIKMIDDVWGAGGQLADIAAAGVKETLLPPGFSDPMSWPVMKSISGVLGFASGLTNDPVAKGLLGMGAAGFAGSPSGMVKSLQGIVPKPFGKLEAASPSLSPQDFVAYGQSQGSSIAQNLADSGSAFVPDVQQLGGGGQQQPQTVDNSIHIGENGTVGMDPAATFDNVRRQQMTQTRPHLGTQRIEA